MTTKCCITSLFDFILQAKSQKSQYFWIFWDQFVPLISSFLNQLFLLRRHGFSSRVINLIREICYLLCYWVLSVN